MKRAPKEPEGKEFYLPHKAVVRETAESTKIGIVNDGSARKFRDKSTLAESLFLLGGDIDQHQRNLQQNFPNEVEEVKRSLHVDDLITGVTTVVEKKSSLGYFQRREIQAAKMAFKSAIPRRATILRESGRTTFNHSTGSKSQPCHARERNGGKTTNHCARVSYGCKEGGDPTAKRTVEQNSGHNRSRLSRPNRQSNQERNPQEYI